MDKVLFNILYTIMNKKYDEDADLMQHLWDEVWDPDHVENDASNSVASDMNLIRQEIEEQMKNS